MITLQEFRTQAEAVISQFATRRQTGSSGWGVGDDRVSIVAERSSGEAAEIAELKRYRSFLDDHNLTWVDGPAAYGGAELSAQHAAMLRQVEGDFVLPDDAYIRFSSSVLTPTLLAHGTEAQKARWLRPLRTAELIACQLYSEPNAGSDLAAVATTAVKDGDNWVLNGQKVWSSGAHYSQLGLCIARTDPTAAKHAGLTTFLVDMSTPGIEVRPIRQLTGGASFDEVFLTDVVVPDAHRIGEVGLGWTVVVTSLLNERSAIGSEVGDDTALVNRLVELAQNLDAELSDDIRDRLADIIIQGWANRETTARFLQGGAATPGPELALIKLLTTNLIRDISDVAADLLGPAHVADTGQWGTYAWSELTLGLPGLRVGGGTDEILKNTIGERVLGLPKDGR